MKTLMGPFAALSYLFFVVSSPGQITTIDPFSGVLSEGWETFPTYRTGYLPNPTAIMGGGALISSPYMAVYESSGSDIFTIYPGLDLQVRDGIRGMGIDGEAPLPVTSISFLQPISDFGAYWAAATSESQVDVSFFGPAGTPVGMQSFGYSGSGELQWHGWHFATPVTTVSYVGTLVAVDALQATPVPEPSSLATALLAAIVLTISRFCRKRLRNLG